MTTEEIIEKYKWHLAMILIGVSLIGAGILFVKNASSPSNSLEVVKDETKEEEDDLVVEVAGAVENPGVYHLSQSARVEDALISAGGVSADADREWMARVINRAAKVTDGQKIYIAKVGENETEVLAKQTGGNSLQVAASEIVNINTASQKELETLWGIGPVTAQNIIEHRPYSSVQKLLDDKIIKSNVYEKNKERLTI